MKNCERCNEVFDETKLSKWATGKFCSKKCANTRVWTEANKKKVSVSCKNSEKLKDAQKLRRKNKKNYKCELCAAEFTDTLRNGRKIHCKLCRRITTKGFDGTLDSFYKLSSRTRTKVIGRMNLGCSACDWNKGTLDIHHIIERHRGGLDTLDNLSPVCPNCHRLLHEGTLKRSDIKSLEEIGNGFNWTEFYFPDKAGL